MLNREMVNMLLDIKLGFSYLFELLPTQGLQTNYFIL